MSAQAQYATKPRLGKVSFSTANANRDGTGTLAVIPATAKKGESTRVDKIQLQASGTTTAGMLRLFITKGIPGETISSITFVGTTATVTTAAPHNRATSERVTVQGVIPDTYNVTDTAITVTGANTYQYTMATTPPGNAQATGLDGATIGQYSTTPAVPDTQLWREVSVTAATPSATVQAFASAMASSQAQDSGYLPLILPAGYSLRFSTHNAEGFNAIVNGGDTA